MGGSIVAYLLILFILLDGVGSVHSCTFTQALLVVLRRCNVAVFIGFVHSWDTKS